MVVSNTSYFHPEILGEDEAILTIIFLRWVVQPPSRPVVGVSKNFRELIR